MAGRPTDWTPNEIEYSPDLLCGFRAKWKGVSERDWCAFAMERHRDWIAATGGQPFDKIDLEYQISLKGRGSRSHGLPRIDAVGWRGEKATLIETKVDVSPSSSMGGVGQLLYYRQVVQSVLGWNVEELILFTPAWPLFLVETVEAAGLPVTLVMATPETFYCRRSLGKQ